MVEEQKPDYHLLLILFLSSLFVIYWTGYTVHNYQSFGNSFWDIGQETYSISFHLHHANMIQGLQFLSFSNHISLFKLLILPLFAIYQSPITLILIQDVSLALTVIV